MQEIWILLPILTQISLSVISKLNLLTDTSIFYFRKLEFNFLLKLVFYGNANTIILWKYYEKDNSKRARSNARDIQQAFYFSQCFLGSFILTIYCRACTACFTAKCNILSRKWNPRYWYENSSDSLDDSILLRIISFIYI